MNAVDAPDGGDLTRRPSDRAVGAALGRAAIALNSTLELDEVLDVLAHEILVHTQAARANVLLCDPLPEQPSAADAPAAPADPETDASADPEADDAAAVPRHLVPAVSLAREPDAEQWEDFRSLGPVELDDRQRAAFARARAVPLPDPAASELIPADLARRFDLQSVVLVPLFAGGRPCGLLAVDYPTRERFERTEIELLEVMAELAGVAVANARLLAQARRRARLRGLLAQAAAELAPPMGRREIADRLAATMHELLDAETLGIGRLEADGRLRPLLATGGQALPEPRPLSEVPARIIEQVAATWHHGVTRACELAADQWLLELLPEELRDRVGGFVLLPLLARGRPVAAVLAARGSTVALEDEVIGAAETLAAVGGAALERRELLATHERQHTRLAVLDRLLAATPEAADAATLRAALREILAQEGVEIATLTFRDRPLRRWMGGAEPTEVDLQLWQRADDGESAGARRDHLVAEPAGAGTLAVVLWARDVPVGAMHVRPADLSRPQGQLLAGVAAIAGQLAERSARLAETERIERSRELDTERGRLAAELEDDLGRWVDRLARRVTVLTDQLELSQPAVREHARELARLADGMQGELLRWVRALENQPTLTRGLVASLRALAASVSAATPGDVELVADDESRLPVEADRLLYRVACGALGLIWGPDGGPPGEAVRIHVDVGRRRQSLTVATERMDPAVPSVVTDEADAPARSSGQEGLATRLEALGGGLEIEGRCRRGLRVHAWLPRELEESVPGGRRAPSDATPYRLTARELQVLDLLAADLTNDQIAVRLGITANTVKSHVAGVLNKLAVADRRAAARKIRAEGLVDSQARRGRGVPDRHPPNPDGGG